ncbi:MAG: nucleotidyltransferase [Gemmatimonadetes bacterium]|nr:nucleotidyltransferase [Gemmatimonadota bacterium]MBT4612621.1 nucleotidyltransferase [Gemmatimonadota bacterium]MBT5054915.1 nucleotidyltransferase [Gemmatimonadota bacterium]MBT5145836.1 nucleotidyltransferase [Gemmatimonadota bacterium]MBT5587817.1 nucleotidyltransferase [Gemmatimonadota bacterium]
MALFGSYARGDQTETSDVDILVEVDPSIGLEFVTLADELEDHLGERVELVSHRSLKPRALEHIQLDLIDV